MNRKLDSLKALSLGVLLSFLAGCGGTVALFTPTPAQAIAETGTELHGSFAYPRMIRLQHAPAPLAGTLVAKTGNQLFRSLDEGLTFSPLSSVATVAGSRERCCSTLFELPQDVGPMPAGTLLYAGSFFSGDVPAIELYTSSDQGATWSYVATPIRAGNAQHGLWEPEFTVAHDGSLLMFVSDETDSCCSQKLIFLRTSDGVHWSPKQNLVASTDAADRPGMATVSVLPSGISFMTYEICGPNHGCRVYSRMATDGANFGEPANLGTPVVSATGQYLVHTPANFFLGETGDLLVISQMVYERDGSVSSGNGKLIFVQKLNSAVANAAPGAWLTRPAPVQVPDAYDNWCPNYSSALLPVRSGLMELASAYDSDLQCTSYLAILPL